MPYYTEQERCKIAEYKAACWQIQKGETAEELLPVALDIGHAGWAKSEMELETVNSSIFAIVYIQWEPIGVMIWDIRLETQKL